MRIEVTLWIGTENRFITDLRSFVQQTPSRNGKTDIEMLFEFEYNHPLQALFIYPFMGSWPSGGCEELLDNWEREIEQNFRL